MFVVGEMLLYFPSLRPLSAGEVTTAGNCVGRERTVTGSGPGWQSGAGLTVNTPPVHTLSLPHISSTHTLSLSLSLTHQLGRDTPELPRQTIYNSLTQDWCQGENFKDEWNLGRKWEISFIFYLYSCTIISHHVAFKIKESLVFISNLIVKYQVL